MSHDRIIRSALWFTVALNTLGVAIFAPAALGFSSPMLPLPGPRYYIAQVACTVGLFGGVYAWLATQRVINRPLVVVGGLGKLGFFLSTLAFALAGDLPLMTAAQASPDLLLAAIFLWWARTTPAD